MVADNLQKLTVNLAAKVRPEVLDGRKYLVAPASLIVPGVLNGSDGALYYPPEEAVKNASAWDGMPLVVYHPLRNGQPVAAQDPEHKEWVWKENGVGHLRNSKANGKLTAEAWFDEELTRNYDRRLPPHVQILPRLLSNTPIELSTGLYVDRDETPGTCPKSGRPYDAVARNYRPDHLAILPDQRGACSNEDGCGIVMNEVPKLLTLNQVREVAANRFSVPTDLVQFEKDIEALATLNVGKYGNPQHGDTGKFQPHGSGSGKGENHAAAVEGHKPTKAGSASEAEEDGTEQGGEVLEDNCSTEMPMTKNADGWVTLPNGVHVEIKDGEIVKGPKIGKKSGKGKDDAEMVELLPDRPKNPGLEKLAASKKSTKNQYQSSGRGQDLTTNEESTMTGATKLPESERKGLVEKIVANCKCGGNVADVEVLNKVSDATLLRLNAMSQESDSGEDSSVVAEEDNAPKKKLPPQFAKNVSAKEWLDAAPPEIQSAVTNAMRVERTARQQLIAKLVANTAKESKEKHEKFLSNKSLDELETLVELMPAPVQNRRDDLFDAAGNVAPVFLGAAGGFEGGHQAVPTFNVDADPEMDPQYCQRQLAKKTA